MTPETNEYTSPFLLQLDTERASNPFIGPRNPKVLPTQTNMASTLPTRLRTYNLKHPKYDMPIHTLPPPTAPATKVDKWFMRWETGEHPSEKCTSSMRISDIGLDGMSIRRLTLGGLERHLNNRSFRRRNSTLVAADVQEAKRLEKETTEMARIF
jgi:hypothetical protein